MERKNDPVRVPVGEQIHPGREKERHGGAALPANQEAHGHEEGGEPRKQDGGAYVVHIIRPNSGAGAPPQGWFEIRPYAGSPALIAR